MIKPINLAKINTRFCSEQDDNKKSSGETRILPNNLKTSLEQGTQKTMSAFIDYPVKGLKGDINSNFYEFLTMGIVPYVIGSGMFMVVFNALNLGKHLGAKDAKVPALSILSLRISIAREGRAPTEARYSPFIYDTAQASTGKSVR